MSLAKRLQPYNIHIRECVADNQGRRICEVSLPTHLVQSLSEQPTTQFVVDEDTITVSLEQQGQHWVFSVWECAPGPCADDFVSLFEERDNAIRAVVEYFLGGPTLLAPWIVPLHRHPELSLEQVRFALGQAIIVSRDAYETIREQRDQKIFGNYAFGNNRWEWALQSRFLALPHLTQPNRVCYLRRDTQEAYIVAHPES